MFMSGKHNKYAELCNIQWNQPHLEPSFILSMLLMSTYENRQKKLTLRWRLVAGVVVLRGGDNGGAARTGPPASTANLIMVSLNGCRYSAIPHYLKWIPWSQLLSEVTVFCFLPHVLVQ